MKALSVRGGWTGQRSRAPTGDFTVAFGHGHPLITITTDVDANILTFSWNAVTIILTRCVNMRYKCEIDRLAIGTWMYIFFKEFTNMLILYHSHYHGVITLLIVCQMGMTRMLIKKKSRMMNLNKVCLTGKCEKGEKLGIRIESFNF